MVQTGDVATEDGGDPVGSTELPENEPWWWDSLKSGSVWSGVFQGGGARGAAYAGALAAVASRDQWFDAVAGSSAGALTACLIAAGYHPSEFRSLTEYLLAGIRPDGLMSGLLNCTPWTRPLVQYDGLELEARLELLLRDGIARHGGNHDGPVTFEALVDAVRIPLYVVALDTTSGQPLVFCAERTGDLPVPATVVASCSIPLAFAPRHIQMDRTRSFTPMQFRRVVDGGAYANLPHFVFTDQAVRQALELAPRSSRPLLFTLSSPSAIPVPQRWIPDPYLTRPAARGAWSALLKRRARIPSKCVCERIGPTTIYKEEVVERGSFRRSVDFAASVAATSVLTVLGVALVLASVIGAALSFVYGANLLRDAESSLLGIAIMLLATAGVLALVMLRRTARAVFRTGLPTLQSVLGQATGAPFWVGLSSYVPALFVPSPGLTTTGFQPRSAVLDCVIGLARESACVQLDHLIEHGETSFETGMRLILKELAKATTERGALDRSFDAVLPDHDHGRSPPPPPTTRRAGPGERRSPSD